MAKRIFNIAVTCVGGVLIYDFVTALRAADDYEVHLIGFDADPEAQGRLLCDEFHVVPRVNESSERWLNAIKHHCLQSNIDALIFLSDNEAVVAAENLHIWQEIGVRTSIGAAKAALTMTDKYLMLQKLHDSGMDVGRFLRVDDQEGAKAAVFEMGYPDQRVVLKPRCDSGSRGVLVCNAGMEQFDYLLPGRLCGQGPLEHVLSVAKEQGLDFENFVAVPFYSGPVFDVECLVQNKELVLTVARRRQLRNEFSPTSTGHIIDQDDRILKYARQMCQILEVDHAADFDIVLRDDGEPTVFDAAARFSGSVGGGVFAGVNIVSQLVRVMMGLNLKEFQIEDKVPLRPFRTLARIPKKNSDQLL